MAHLTFHTSNSGGHAEGGEERAQSPYLLEASLAHLTRKITEARSVATAEWIRDRSGREQRYRPPKGGKMRKALSRARKELASRFYQLLSGHAAVAEHLTRIGQAPEIRRLWQRIRLDTGWGGASSVRRLFGDERAVPAILGFLEDTRVGKIPGRALLAGGPDLEEEELEYVSLRAREEEEETGMSSSEEEDGPGPPS